MKWALFSARSGKREVAISLLILWGFVSGYLFLWIPHEWVVDYKELYSSLTTAIMLWSGGAFGFEFAARSGLAGMTAPGRMAAPAGRQMSPPPVSRRPSDDPD